MIIEIEIEERVASIPVTVTLPDEDSAFEAPYPAIITNGGLDLVFDEEIGNFVRPEVFPKEDLVNSRGYAVITIKPGDVATDHDSRTGAFYEIHQVSLHHCLFRNMDESHKTHPFLRRCDG